MCLDTGRFFSFSLTPILTPLVSLPLIPPPLVPSPLTPPPLILPPPLSPIQWVWHPSELNVPYKFLHFYRHPFKKIVSGYR